MEMVRMRVNTIVLAFRELNNAIKGKARKLVIGTVALIPFYMGLCIYGRLLIHTKL